MKFDVDKAIKIGSALGKLFGGGAKQQSSDRQGKDTVNTQRDRNAIEAMSEREQALIARAALELKQREFDAASRESGYRQSLRSQYLQNWTPAQRPNGIQMIHGGFNTVSDASRQTAKEMERQATLRLLNGEHFDALPAMQNYIPSPMSTPSTWEKLSGILGLGLTGGAAIADIFNGKSSKKPAFDFGDDEYTD
jgi:hypothetical protein